MLQQSFDSTSHFLSRFVGECQSKNAPWCNPFGNQGGDSVGHNCGFATAGSSIHQQRPPAVVHHRPLGRRKTRQIGLKCGGRRIGVGQVHAGSLSRLRTNAASRPQPRASDDLCNVLQDRDLRNTRHNMEDLVVRRFATTRYWGIFRAAPPSSPPAFWLRKASWTERRFVQVSVQLGMGIAVHRF